MNVQDPWVDQERQQLRPYALTAGRTRPDHAMDLSSLLRTRRNAEPGRPLGPEEQRARDLCRDRPRSVAEIAGTLDLPAPVVKVLLSDLLQCGALIVTTPHVHYDPRLLEDVLAGLRAKFAV